jgi:hypothetical protein
LLERHGLTARIQTVGCFEEHARAKFPSRLYEAAPQPELAVELAVNHTCRKFSILHASIMHFRFDVDNFLYKHKKAIIF